ncbi:hypothetical protein [Minwuia sp.]|uniref:hypothetical protein n=1 Tax=Minwuia sp. TaxID=2493630 RepID=UPI003A94E79A
MRCFLIPALLTGLLFAPAAMANDLLNLLPGASSGANPGSVYQAKPTYDRADQRRVPQYRHQSQMARHHAQRSQQRAQAERAWSQTVVAPAARSLPTPIRPTVFDYSAALAYVLRIAEGDRVIFRTSGRSGFIELLDITTTGDRICRTFRQSVRTPKGPEVSFGSACRMRDGAWRFAKN